MKIRKITALLLVMSAISALGGCGRTEEAANNAEVSETETVTETETETVTEAEELPSGVFEDKNAGIRVDAREKFEITDQDSSTCQLECKDAPVYAVVKDCYYMYHVTSKGKAEKRLEQLEEKGVDAELSVYDTSYGDCVRIRYRSDKEADTDEDYYFDEYFLRMEYSALQLVLIYPESYMDDIDEYADYLFSSVTHESPSVSDNKGGIVENEFVSVRYSDKIYADTTVYPKNAESAKENGEKTEYDIDFRYNMTDSVELSMTGLTISVVQNDFYDTAEEYFNNRYEQLKIQDNDFNITDLEKSEEKLFGHKGLCLSYNSDHDNNKLHIVLHCFEDNDIQYRIIESYPQSDDGTCAHDIKELMDNIVLK